MKILITFYTKEPKPPEIHWINDDDGFLKYNERIVQLAKSGAKFTVHMVGKCIGDFS